VLDASCKVESGVEERSSWCVYLPFLLPFAILMGFTQARGRFAMLVVWYTSRSCVVPFLFPSETRANLFSADETPCKGFTGRRRGGRGRGGRIRRLNHHLHHLLPLPRSQTRSSTLTVAPTDFVLTGPLLPRSTSTTFSFSFPLSFFGSHLISSTSPQHSLSLLSLIAYCIILEDSSTCALRQESMASVADLIIDLYTTSSVYISNTHSIT
jgi:hypothetical protein